jgi:hypothetical protein
VNKSSKILILVTYFERPNLVRGLLRSIATANQYYENWSLAFIDDGSQQPGQPIVERVLKDMKSKIRFFNTEMSPEMKSLCKGTFIGLYMNQAIDESDADLVIMIGDDDEICPDYLVNLNLFFHNHPDCLSCYSNTYVFNPMTELASATKRLYSDNPNWKGHGWFGKPINPARKVDGIQVAFRSSCCKMYGARFPYPIAINHDAIFFEELYNRCGPSIYTGFIGTWKGRHDGQLVKRESLTRGIKDKKPKLFL